MLFTWDTNNLCIVFRSWRVTSTMSLIWSLLGVVLLTAGYELVREISRRYEAKVQKEIDDMPSKSLCLSHLFRSPCHTIYHHHDISSPFPFKVFLAFLHTKRQRTNAKQHTPQKPTPMTTKAKSAHYSPQDAQP